MKQKTGIEISRDTAIAKVIAKYSLWIERFNFVSFAPLIAAIPAFIVITLLAMPGTIIDRFKNFIWLGKWLFAGIYSFIGSTGKDFDCVAGFAMKKELLRPIYKSCTGSQYYSDSLAAGISRMGAAAVVGLIVAVILYRYIKARLVRENDEATDQMNHFNVKDGAIMSTPDEIKANMLKEMRGEEWKQE